MADLISRQAAITAIQKAYADTEGGTDKCAVWKNVGLTNALHIMQDLLSAQPDVPGTNVGDMIYRRAAIDAIESCEPGEERFMITSLPSAQSERKTGEWSVEFSPAYKGGAYCECSQCNYKFAMGAYFEPDEWNFCPYCGADMRGEA